VNLKKETGVRCMYAGVVLIIGMNQVLLHNSVNQFYYTMAPNWAGTGLEKNLHPHWKGFEVDAFD
jgi:hypothetical protein